MEDITSRKEIETLMSAFYSKLLIDNSINYIFTEVAQINMEEHLAIIVDFWEQSLFHKGNYNRNVLEIHLNLNQKMKLTESHFATWLATFNSTVDLLYKGDNAEKIKTRALSIATVMQIKLHNTNQQ
ncbi:group III truncated hemoglobin [Flavobacterium sp. '19STA2R22 D10 B1']|uniref:group III truncated hemoglobin n=1 Tax=Flavobacterium aerium TaxID=3037261 RepID=UPI00278C79A1|nr:group III truncated hemoglobin [Flavobacterium sp. '19STA2R22 D10 B1']